MPLPSSLTQIVIRPSPCNVNWTWPVTVIVESGGECFIAFVIKLVSTYYSLCASNLTLVPRKALKFVTIWIPTCSAYILCKCTQSSTYCLKSARQIIGTIFPPSSKLLSNKSYVWHISNFPQLFIIRLIFLDCSSSAFDFSISVSEKQIMPLMGTTI